MVRKCRPPLLALQKPIWALLIVPGYRAAPALWCLLCLRGGQSGDVVYGLLLQGDDELRACAIGIIIGL